ncbi:metallophosphoesterase [Orbus sturtevantii]|uniref:metallophosphoesterase n=1 Tax=Orbus sturtevantii TaxID=3074109 RepID=UPI00370D10CA
MNWFLAVAVITSLIIAFYLGFRVINLFNLYKQGYFNTISKKIVWLMIVVGSLSFVLSRVFFSVSDYWLPLISSLVFSFILCLFYSIVIIDVLRLFLYLVFRRKGNYRLILQIIYITMTMVFFIVGLYMASAPRIINYQITIDKPARVKQLKIVQLSDIHLNQTTSRHFIQTMVNDVNSLKPDYIFITGDTLDQRLKPYLDKNLAELFAQLKSTYGTFIIFGNHEHYGIEREKNNSNEDVIKAFTAGNMKVLQDSVFYDNATGITIIGRDDYVVKNFGKTRADLPTLLSLVDENDPVILLDHQPQNLTEPADLGIDVMFSGHTHAGQIFPMTLVVNAMYKNAWGLEQPVANNPFMSIVSSGYGLWGPPIRLMTRAEIVVTELTFK